MHVLIGEILIRERIIDARQLDEAINAQVIFGGKIGSSLLDLGFVDEHCLTRQLSRQLNIPTVPLPALMRIEPRVLATIHRVHVSRHKVLPFKVEGRRLHLLMLNPLDLAAIDEIGFAIEMSITPYIAPELRILSLLQHYYGLRPELRSVALSPDGSMSFARLLRATSQSVPAAASPAPLAALEPDDRDRAAFDFREFDARSLPVDPDESAAKGDKTARDDTAPMAFVALGALVTQPIHPPAPPPRIEPISHDDDSEPLLLEDELFAEAVEPITLPEALRAVERAESRDDIARVVLGFALYTFSRAALFVVRGDMVMGWYGLGNDTTKA